jgi:hypothetical protein
MLGPQLRLDLVVRGFTHCLPTTISAIFSSRQPTKEEGMLYASEYTTRDHRLNCGWVATRESDIINANTPFVCKVVEPAEKWAGMPGVFHFRW